MNIDYRDRDNVKFKKGFKMKLDDAKTRDVPKAFQKKETSISRTSAFTDVNRTEITYLSVDQLMPYSKQARTIFNEDEINHLAETIQAHGIRQPLTVLRIEGEVVRFEVVSGERRLRAAKKIGLHRIPCIVVEDADKAEEIALIENVQRTDLHPLELARGLKKLVDKIGYGAQSELGKSIGMSQSQISELLKLLTLPPEVQDEILKENLRGRDNFRSLYKLGDVVEQIHVIREKAKEQREPAAEKNKNELPVKTVVRLTMFDDNVKLQKPDLSTLSSLHKQLLRNILLQMLNELDEEGSNAIF